MSLHPIFETILSQKSFGNGRTYTQKTLKFATRSEKEAWIDSEAWLRIFWGYGGAITSQTENTLTYMCSNSAD